MTLSEKDFADLRLARPVSVMDFWTGEISEWKSGGSLARERENKTHNFED